MHRKNKENAKRKDRWKQQVTKPKMISSWTGTRVEIILIFNCIESSLYCPQSLIEVTTTRPTEFRRLRRTRPSDYASELASCSFRERSSRFIPLTRVMHVCTLIPSLICDSFPTRSCSRAHDAGHRPSFQIGSTTRPHRWPEPASMCHSNL
jgi:hypothetical protein